MALALHRVKGGAQAQPHAVDGLQDLVELVAAAVVRHRRARVAGADAVERRADLVDAGDDGLHQPAPHDHEHGEGQRQPAHQHRGAHAVDEGGRGGLALRVLAPRGGHGELDPVAVLGEQGLQRVGQQLARGADVVAVQRGQQVAVDHLVVRGRGREGLVDQRRAHGARRQRARPVVVARVELLLALAQARLQQAHAGGVAMGLRVDQLEHRQVALDDVQRRREDVGDDGLAAVDGLVQRAVDAHVLERLVEPHQHRQGHGHHPDVEHEQLRAKGQAARMHAGSSVGGSVRT